jgi:predicted AAA+ superfamily ATPase
MIRYVDRLDKLFEKVEGLIDRLSPPVCVQPDFENCLAFRWESSGTGGRLTEVTHPHLFDLSDLVGVDDIRDAVVRNTAQFVAGLPANNVLLWGERGCGKSSLVKGLLKAFAQRGLRLIDLKRRDILALHQISEVLREQSYYFILFCDDLSFDEGEGDFRALKTLLDGDIEELPANILIYATSNRRHLLPEKLEDNTLGREIHHEEVVGEKLALSDRFGLSLGFYCLGQEEYLQVVRHYASRRNLDISEEILRDTALKWSLSSARRSGRSARQFIDDLEGRLGLPDT